MTELRVGIGVDAHAFADGVPLVGIDLTGAFLLGARLVKADLSRSTFNSADLRFSSLEDANLAENQPHDDILEHARYMRDNVIPAMAAVRAVADRLEKVVADDLWPLPKYSEILFIN